MVARSDPVVPTGGFRNPGPAKTPLRGKDLIGGIGGGRSTPLLDVCSGASTRPALRSTDEARVAHVVTCEGSGAGQRRKEPRAPSRLRTRSSGRTRSPLRTRRSAVESERLLRHAEVLRCRPFRRCDPAARSRQREGLRGVGSAVGDSRTPSAALALNHRQAVLSFGRSRQLAALREDRTQGIRLGAGDRIRSGRLQRRPVARLHFRRHHVTAVRVRDSAFACRLRGRPRETPIRD